MSSANIQTMVNRYSKLKIQEQTKIREVLQELALFGLERHGFFEKAAFYGGTALRILYKLDRFSEDLGFTLLEANPNFDFGPFLEGMRKEIAEFGYEMEVEQKKKNLDTSVISAWMKGNSIELLLAFGEEAQSKKSNRDGKIQIKLEVDTDPLPYVRLENRPVYNPTPFNVLTLHLSDLFAGNVDALLHREWKGRVKGRDWFDLIWYIRKAVPLGLKSLESSMKKSGNLKKDSLDRKHIVELLEEKIHKVDWESAKADVIPFIVDSRILDMWSASFFLELVRDNLRVEA